MQCFCVSFTPPTLEILTLPILISNLMYMYAFFTVLQVHIVLFLILCFLTWSLLMFVLLTISYFLVILMSILTTLIILCFLICAQLQICIVLTNQLQDQHMFTMMELNQRLTWCLFLNPHCLIHVIPFLLCPTLTTWEFLLNFLRKHPKLKKVRGD